MIATVKFASVRETRLMIPSPTTALISIHDSDLGVPLGITSEGWGFFDDIGFDDAVYTEQTIQDYGPHFWTYFNGCAGKLQSLKIMLMFKEIGKLEYIDELIIQCSDGISRSAAVAKYYAELKELPLVGDTRRANPLIYRLLKNPNVFEEAFKKYVDLNTVEFKENNNSFSSISKSINKLFDFVLGFKPKNQTR